MARALAGGDVAEALASTDGAALAGEVRALSPSQVEEVRGAAAALRRGSRPRCPPPSSSGLGLLGVTGLRLGSPPVPRLAFLGPHATFTEQALRSLPEAEGAELVPCAGSPAVLAAVRDGRADAGCVPIENTVEGAVPPVLDGLLDDPPLVIVREALLAVRFAVLVRPGTTRRRTSARSPRTPTASPRPATGSPRTCRTPRSW